MNSIIRTFLFTLLLLPLYGVISQAADAPDVDQSVVSMEDTIADQYNMPASSNAASQNNFYMGLSVNVLSGDNTQDDGGNWGNDYTDQPIWYDESSSFGLNFGKYIYTTKKSRQALEVNYVPQLKSEDDVVSNGSTLVNEYNDIVTLEYQYLYNINNNVEIFGSAGVGSMSIRGGQFDNTNDNRAAESESFVTYGGGVLLKLDDNYDFKFGIKYLPNFETEELALGANFTSRTLGLEDAYIATASILYNF